MGGSDDGATGPDLSVNDAELARLSDMINRRDFTAAYELAMSWRGLDPTGVMVHDARFWFQLALACGLVASDQTLRTHELALRRAKECQNYSLVMEGDIMRDQALMELRRGRYEAAMDAAFAAALAHTGDPNRQACIYMVRARIRLAQDRSAMCALEAAAMHRRANRTWQRVLDSDRQWVMNNRFHWLHALALSPRRWRKRRTMSGLLALVLMHDPSQERKLAALALYCGGRSAGLKLLDRQRS